jgi:U3 small nucleolar RNA-associated protein 18
MKRARPSDAPSRPAGAGKQASRRGASKGGSAPPAQARPQPKPGGLPLPPSRNAAEAAEEARLESLVFGGVARAGAAAAPSGARRAGAASQNGVESGAGGAAARSAGASADAGGGAKPKASPATAAAWHDDDDDDIAVDISGVSRLRKLRATQAETVVSGAE